MEYRLITAVSGFPCLYDRSSPTYRDLNMRGDAWREVSQLVGVNETDCRRKWKMLRDQHRRERYRERERRESGVGLLNYRPWRYAAILSFLNPFIDARAAGTNGWALDPRTPQQDMVGCSMNMEMRSDDDDSYGIAVADATTTTASCSPGSMSEFVQRKRSSSVGAEDPRQKEARLDQGAVAPVVQHMQQVNVRELCETMMQAVTSLATSLASSQSDTTALHPSQLLKTEELEVTDAELLDPTDDEYESPRSVRYGRKNTEGLLEDCPKRGDAQREQDVEQRDHVTLFLLSLAPAIRRLPAEKQSWVKTKVQQIVHEAEFGPTSFQ